MVMYSLSLRYVVHGHGNEFVLEEQLEALSDALDRMSRIVEPELRTDLAEATVTVDLQVEADSPPEALGLGLIAVKVAAGIATDHTGRIGIAFHETEQTVSAPRALRPTTALRPSSSQRSGEEVSDQCGDLVEG